jgi:hypothetical protein
MTATQRREAELRALESEGVRVLHLSRWHCRIGSIHLWLATGRWMNEVTNARGKINRTALRQLIDHESEMQSQGGSCQALVRTSGPQAIEDQHGQKDRS